MGLEGPDPAGTKRAIRHRVEDRKRKVIPANDWDHYGVRP